MNRVMPVLVVLGACGADPPSPSAGGAGTDGTVVYYSDEESEPGEVEQQPWHEGCDEVAVEVGDLSTDVHEAFAVPGVTCGFLDRPDDHDVGEATAAALEEWALVLTAPPGAELHLAVLDDEGKGMGDASAGQELSVRVQEGRAYRFVVRLVSGSPPVPWRLATQVRPVSIIDSGPTDSVTDSGGLVLVSEGGVAEVNPTTGSWLGTHSHRLDRPGSGELCHISQLMVHTTALGVPLVGADLGACSYGGQPCEFAFEVTAAGAIEEPGSDCAAFGISAADVPDLSTAYGNIEQYDFGSYTSVTLLSDVLMIWYDDGGYTGWYPDFDSVVAPYYGLPPTDFDGSNYVYTVEASYGFLGY